MIEVTVEVMLIEIVVIKMEGVVGKEVAEVMVMGLTAAEVIGDGGSGGRRRDGGNGCVGHADGDCGERCIPSVLPSFRPSVLPPFRPRWWWLSR
jgi:hypothetical protein